MKPDEMDGVYLAKGYTQVGPVIGIESSLNTNSDIINKASITVSLPLGAMFSSPSVKGDDNGRISGFTKDKCNIAGVGGTLSIMPKINISNSVNIFGGVSIHGSTTSPMYIQGTNNGPGRINTLAYSSFLGAQFNVKL